MHNDQVGPASTIAYSSSYLPCLESTFSLNSGCFATSVKLGFHSEGLLAVLLAGLLAATGGFCRLTSALSTHRLGLDSHPRLHSHGFVAGLLLCHKVDEAGLVIQLADAAAVADYHRLVPGRRTGGQVIRLLAATPPGFRSLDRAYLPLPGGGRHYLYPLEKTLVEDIGLGDGGADNPDHDCLLCRGQAQCTRLSSSNLGDADSAAKPRCSGANAEA